MSEDVFAFFRGTAHLFAANWESGVRPVEPGPDILLCGDLHLENFGIYVSEDRQLIFDINDFDETLVAPAAFDLSRCLTSILLAADVWKLRSVRAERIAVAFLDRYRLAIEQMADPNSTHQAPAKLKLGPIFELLGMAARTTQAELLKSQTRITKANRLVLRGRNGLHPRLPKAEQEEILEALHTHARTTPHPDAYRVLSLRGRIAGIGSLGVRRYLVLTEGDGPPDGYWLLDVKQSLPSVVQSFISRPPEICWNSDADRILLAQRQLLPRPPASLSSLRIGDASFRMRSMIPAENRARLDAFRYKVRKLSQGVIIAGHVTGCSQARGARYLGESRYQELADWSRGPGLESILVTAIRHARLSRRAYQEFCRALNQRDPRLQLPHIENL